MGLFDDVSQWALEKSLQVKNTVDRMLPDFGSLPTVSNPAVLTVKALWNANQLATMTGTNLALKGQGIEPFPRLPSDYVIDEQQSTDVQDRSMYGLVTKSASAAVDTVKSTVSDLLTVSPSSSIIPLWVKFTIAGAVVVGSAVMLQSLVSGGRRYA